MKVFAQTHCQSLIYIQDSMMQMKSPGKKENVLNFHSRSYPFLDALNSSIVAFQTLPDAPITPVHLHKLLHIVHVNIVALKRVHKNQQAYQFHYEVVPYSLTTLLAHPRANPRIYNMLLQTDLSSLLRSVLMYLLEIGVSYHLQIEDVGFSEDGILKLYLSPDSILDPPLTPRDMMQTLEFFLKKVSAAIERNGKLMEKVKPTPTGTSHVDPRKGQPARTQQTEKELTESASNAPLQAPLSSKKISFLKGQGCIREELKIIREQLKVSAEMRRSRQTGLKTKVNNNQASLRKSKGSIKRFEAPMVTNIKTKESFQQNINFINIYKRKENSQQQVNDTSSNDFNNEGEEEDQLGTYQLQINAQTKMPKIRVNSLRQTLFVPKKKSDQKRKPVNVVHQDTLPKRIQQNQKKQNAVVSLSQSDLPHKDPQDRIKNIQLEQLFNSMFLKQEKAKGAQQDLLKKNKEIAQTDTRKVEKRQNVSRIQLAPSALNYEKTRKKIDPPKKEDADNRVKNMKKEPSERKEITCNLRLTKERLELQNKVNLALQRTKVAIEIFNKSRRAHPRPES